MHHCYRQTRLKRLKLKRCSKVVLFVRTVDVRDMTVWVFTWSKKKQPDINDYVLSEIGNEFEVSSPNNSGENLSDSKDGQQEIYLIDPSKLTPLDEEPNKDDFVLVNFKLRASREIYYIVNNSTTKKRNDR